jgi:hypothetical protein
MRVERRAKTMDGGGFMGPFSSGSGSHAEGMGVMGGGGWVDAPLSVSTEHGHGLWAQPPAADGEPTMGSISEGEGQDKILGAVMGWDGSMVHPRIGDL